MGYLKWKCSCGKTFISNSKRHHQLDMCKKCGDFVDFEEYGTRIGSNNIKQIEDSMIELDYDFFEEILTDLNLQGFEPFIDFGEGKHFINITTIYQIRELEDEILEGLK